MVSDALVEKALAEISKRDANYQYFFQQLKSPAWIEPLYGRGFFQKPPAVETKGEYITVPFWPESRYLARMAAVAPDKVREIFLKLPETDNMRVHEDVIDAALQMPASAIRKLVEKEIRWMKKQGYLRLFLPHKIADLLTHLSKGGQSAVALRLAGVALTLQPQERPDQSDAGQVLRRIPPEPRGVIDDWHYEQILKNQMPDLVALAGLDALDLLSDLLQEAARFSVEPEESRENYEDYSWIWRPAIEDHSQNQFHSVRSTLVTAVRNAASWLLENNKTTVDQLVQALEGRKWTVFRRMAFHVLAESPAGNMDVIAKHLVDPGWFHDRGIRHEYCRLLRVAFEKLPDPDREAILQWIDQGPERESRSIDPGVENGEDENYAIVWKLNRLAPIRDSLPPMWSDRYREWVSRVGEPSHPDFLSYSTGVMVGPTSPKDAAELAAMSVSQIVAFLRQWEVPDDFMGPSAEGLSRAITSVVESRPEEFAASCLEFIGVDPTYVRGLLRGLHDAARKKRPFDWESVLGLCIWVVKQPRSLPGRDAGDMERDPDWGWTRHEVARLLSEGFEMRENGIPYRCRSVCWEILQPLTEDPDPSRAQEVKGGADLDPATQSINATRGEALHAVMRYAVWIRTRSEVAERGQDGGPSSLDDMPEVRQVLNLHLEPEHDPAASTRAVYGWWLQTLHALDRTWLSSKLGRLFPDQEEYGYLRLACWETYVVFGSPWKGGHEFLEREYRRGINEIGAHKGYKTRSAEPDVCLANHLMTFFWHGDLELGESGLLTDFFTRATNALRCHALEFVGRTLQEQASVPVDTLKRLKALWSLRLRACKENRKLGAELVGFGWWLISRKFEDQWALEQANEVLTLGCKIEPDFMVVEQLADTAAGMPNLSVECLRLIIENDQEGWAIHGWEDGAKSVLGTCLKSGDAAAVEKAEQLIHRLGAKGYLGFRDLLKKNDVSE